MCASPLKFLRFGPPPPRVAILPDAVFFSRAVPVAADATRAQVVSEVGLALESLSPFPLAQLYFGYYWTPGASRALAFASYRRRFTVDQVAEWAGAQHVMPAFAAVLGSDVQPATTVILSAPDGLTAVHWSQGNVPSLVLHRVLGPEATEEERARARSELIRDAGEARTVVDAPSPPVAQPSRSDREVSFAAGELRSKLDAVSVAALDVRDKADMAALSRARKRDVLLWRVAMGSVLACFVFLAGEAALFGAGLWEKARIAKVGAQRAEVSRIMSDQDLAYRIDELSTKRLLPLEMISIVAGKKPATMQFLRATATTSSLYTIQIEAQTTNAGEIGGFKTALEQLPGCDHVEIRDQLLRNNIASFTLFVTFKPTALPPATS
jgi:hypothetical protein